MQKLGAALGVSGMALYRHFRDKGELVDAILDHFVRAAAVTDHGVPPKDWRGWLLATSRAMYRALAEAPGVLPFIATSRAWRFGPAALATRDETLHVLREAGFEGREALEIHTTAVAMAVGWATLASGDEDGADAPSPLPDGLFELGLGRYLGALDAK